jgi:uncharacterized protein involved in exopolysaccharide biosynthesis
MKNQENSSEFLLTIDSAYWILGLFFRKLPILGAVFLISAVAVFAVLSTSPVQYEAESILILAPPIKKDSNKQLEDDVTSLMPEGLTVQDYKLIVTTDSVLKKLRDDNNWTDKSGNLIKLKTIQDATNAETSIIKKTNVDIQHSPLLVLRVKCSSEVKAAEYANAWADMAVEISREYAVSSVQGLKEFFEEEFGSSSIEYEAMITKASVTFNAFQEQINTAKKTREEKLSEFFSEKETQLAVLKNTLNLELLEKQITNLEKVVDTQKTAYETTGVEAAGLKEMVRTLETELAIIPDKITLNKGLTDTAMALLSENDPTAQSILSVIAQEVNPAYISIQQQLAEKRAKYKETSTRYTDLEARLTKNRAELKTLRHELENGKVELAKMEKDFEAKENILKNELDRYITKIEQEIDWTKDKISHELGSQANAYSTLLNKMNSARLAEAETTPDLRKLVDAKASKDPLPRGRATKSLGAAIFLTVLTFMLLLIFASYREYNNKQLT